MSSAAPDPGERKSLPAVLRERRTDAMVSELEAVALRLFEEHGVANVTIDDVASAAGISVRTFYRYFTAKEDVLQLRLRRGAEFLRARLKERPADESPLRSLQAVLKEQLASDDTDAHARWIRVIAANPSVLGPVMGAIQLNIQAAIEEFFAERLGLSRDSLAPGIWAAAVGGVVQGANIRWYVHGGDLAQIMSEGFEVLERGIPERIERRGNGTEMLSPRHGRRRNNAR
jgi:TetR/AcrR family transcriptional regulator, regulator of mycofactocin system